MNDKKIHFSIESEQAVLGALMIDNEVLERVSDVLTVADFYHDAHKVIYSQILKLIDELTPADVITVSEALRDAGLLESIGAMPYIVKLADGVPGASNARYYAKIVLEKATLRKIDELSAEAVDATGSPLSSKDVINSMQLEYQKLLDRQESLDQGFKAIKPLLMQNVESLQDRYANFKEGTTVAEDSIETGFNSLDEITHGLRPGELIIVAGRPSMGKTAFSMNIAEYAAINNKKSVAIFSMEMQATDISCRLIGSVGRIDSGALRSGNLGDNDWERLSVALGKLNETKINIDETPALTVSQLSSRAKRLKAKIGKLDLIIVDYIQLMGSNKLNKNETRANEVAEITKGLKRLAKELQVPIIALSQLNRDLEKRPNKRPQMSDLRESGAIEQDADLILFLYRDEIYNPDSEQKGIAEIIIGKQRNGRIGTVRTAFHGEYTRFENLNNSYSNFESF